MRSSSRRLLAALSAAAACLLGSVGLVPGLGPAAAASAAPGGTSVSQELQLGLLAQTTWVTPKANFDLQFSVSGPGATSPQDLEVVLLVFQALTTRSNFTESQSGRGLGGLLWSQYYPLDKVPGVPGGYGLCVPVETRPGPSCRASAPLLTGNLAGVFPVELEVRDVLTGAVAARLFTHLVTVPSTPASDPLSVALIVPVSASGTLSAGGVRRVGRAATDRIDLLQSDLQSHGSVSLTLAPDPSTLSALAATPGPVAKSALSGLRRLVPGTQVLALPFAPVQPYQLSQSGLAGELAAQMSRGAEVDQAELGSKPSPATWLLQGPLDRATLRSMDSQGAFRLILPADDLTPSSLITRTPDQLFPVDVGTQTVAALTTDAGLEADLSIGDPVLAAHELLADLSQIYFESPNLSRYENGRKVPEPRGVVVLAPSNWSPSANAFLALVNGLTNSPILRSATVNGLFSTLSTSTVRRQPANPGPRRFNLEGPEIRSLRARLDSLDASAQRPLPSSVLIGDLILTSESADLGTAARRRYLAQAELRLQHQFDQVSVAASGITLTSREATIPISIISQLPVPLRVQVLLTSVHLGFAGSNGGDTIRRYFTLTLRDTTWLVKVTTRTSGSFDMTARVETASGGAVLDTARVRITSRAYSGVGIVLSVAALAALAFWWGRALQRGRRNRRLIQREASGP